MAQQTQMRSFRAASDAPEIGRVFMRTIYQLRREHVPTRYKRTLLNLCCAKLSYAIYCITT